MQTTTRHPATPSTARPSRPPEAQLSCGNCDIAIAGQPVFHVGLAFCCAGCVAAGPCTCSYDLELPEKPAGPIERTTRVQRVHECLDVTAVGGPVARGEEQAPALTRR